MGRGNEQGTAGAAVSGRARNGGAAAIRRAVRLAGSRRVVLLAPLALILTLVFAATASAAGPRWELITDHAPTDVPRTPSTPQTWTLSVAGNVGKLKLEVEVEGKRAEKTKLPLRSSAEQVQAALEGLKAIGKNVTVTGGPSSPTQTEWSYVVKFTGALEGLDVPLFEAEAVSGTPKEEKEVEAGGGEVEEPEASTEETYEASRNTVVYRLMLTNRSSEPSSGPITVTDKLPAGLVTEESNASQSSFWTCTPEGEGAKEVTCTSTGGVVNPDAEPDALVIRAYADPSLIKDGEELVNEAQVSGGGAALTEPAEKEPPALVSETPAPFGIHVFKAASFTAKGEIDTEAADHPFAATATFLFNTIDKYTPWDGQSENISNGNLKDADVVLPEGFIGNPAGPYVEGKGRPRCSQSEFLLGAKGQIGEASPILGCPSDTQVGTVNLFVHEYEEGPTTVPLYNLNPPAGAPAEFGFLFLNTPVRLDAHVRKINGKYRVTVLSPDVNEAFSISGISLTLWGVPADSSHDAERDQTANHNLKGEASNESPQRPFLTNPADCLTQTEEAPVTVLHYDQWEIPGSLNSEGEPLLGGNEAAWHEAVSEPLKPVTGCNELKFEPKVEFTPSTTQADAPSGYKFGLEIPQSETPTTRGTPQLRNTTVTLPAGVSLSPSAANGLQKCEDKQIDLESTAAGSCPEASQAGEVHIRSELLPEELTGRVYIGEPECSPCSEKDDLEGHLFRLFIEAEAPQFGVRIKLPGTAVAGTPATEAAGGLKVGQVRTTFANNPQLPFTKLTLNLKGGPRATLANPPTCGTYTTESLLTPWSEGGTFEGKEVLGTVAEPQKSAFNVSWDGAGAECPGTLPFAPSFGAGTENATAGAYSPLITVFKRADEREQDFNGITVQTPPGLLGKIAGVSKCEVAPEALEKEEAVCPANSRIAMATTAAGSGTSPFVVSGPVYLTGASRSAKTGAEGPFGLDIVVPAKAGPFNLGTVVVHAVIDINKSTSALTITSDPLPQSIDGVPFRVQDIQVRVDRPEFTFNPTNCESGAGHEITASLSGKPQKAEEPSATSHVAVPFTATGCSALPFNPTFTAGSTAHFSKKLGASLTVRVAQHRGEANIRKVELQLPEALPSQLETLHKACPDYVFEANPANCPEGSYVGTATATTPLLNVPLTGPAILVSHANREFPDLVYLLQGEGVHIELVGNTYIAHGITYSKFETVPDAPISSFETTLPTGHHALLTAYGNICAKELIAPTTITSQSNLQVKQNTRITVAECPPTVSIAGTKAGASSILVTVKVSQAGTVKISGSGLKTVTKRGVSAGTHKISVPLTTGGRALARKHKKLHVQVTVTAAGRSGSATATLKA
jgi:hypothetical protein